MAAAVAGPSELLNERLIEVALELLEEEGLEAFSLRSIARRTGVSHGAPLRHFRSFADLCSEVAARGFRMLSDAIDRSGAGVPVGAGPLARLAAAGRAYADCAVANPGLFALMFRPEYLDVANAAFQREAPAAFEQLVRHVRAAQDTGWHPRRDTRVLAGSIWAGMHGLATLWAQGAYAAVLPGVSLETLVSTTQELVVTDPPGGA